MGSGQTGAVAFKNNSYYWNRGTSKFSEIVMGRWTEETKGTATYPRLSTSNGDNNFRNSTFWMYTLDGGHESGFLAADESSCTQAQVNVKVKAGSENVFA